MTSLIACLGAGKGTWGYIAKLIESEPWEHVFLVTDEFGTKFSANMPIEFVIINENMMVAEIIELIKKQLENKINDTEVALNIVSGSGKIHMAILSSLLKLGLGIRLVTLTPEGMKEI